MCRRNDRALRTVRKQWRVVRDPRVEPEVAGLGTDQTKVAQLPLESESTFVQHPHRREVRVERRSLDANVVLMRKAPRDCSRAAHRGDAATPVTRVNGESHLRAAIERRDRMKT